MRTGHAAQRGPLRRNGFRAYTASVRGGSLRSATDRARVEDERFSILT